MANESLLPWVLVGSGLLYGGIGVLWLVVLGRSWLHRRTLVRAERSAPASSRQRILGPRTDRRTRSRTVLSVPSPAGSAAAPVPAGPSWSIGPSRAVRRRRRILLLLAVLTAAAAALFVVGRVSWWVPVAAAVAAVGWFVTGASAARAGRRARRGHRRRVRSRELARGVPPPRSRTADEPSWNSVPLVDVVARWGRDESDTDGIDRRRLTAAAPLIQVPQSPVVADPPLVAAWQPVPVPLPTYLTAPRVPRTVARIDLACAGSWTAVVAPAEPAAGRGPIQLGGPAAVIDPRPRARPRPRPEVEPAATDSDDALTAEVPYELPRAVGD